MKFRFILWIMLVFAVAFVLLTGEALLNRRKLEEKTLRLHVVANSDSPEDQAQKIRVRDHVLQLVAGVTAQCVNREEAEVALRPCLKDLENSVRELLRNEGSTYGVRITLCQEEFTTRDYETFSLPAGTYHSLRVTIGEGNGKNWWCVVFPSLCTASTVEQFTDTARQGGYGEEEIGLIRKQESQYIVQFKLIEFFRELFR